MTKIVGFEHLHRHSDHSTLDGLAQVEEYAERSLKINQKYLCISDHGVMGCIPRQIKACEKTGLIPIFACELYVNDMQGKCEYKDLSPAEKKEFATSYHLLAIAYNNEGYRNLVQLSSWGWLNGFYRKPRVTYEQLLKHKEGIIFTSCCYNSEIGRAFDRGGKEAAYQMLEKYIAMLAPNFYLELMLLDFKKQKPYDAFLIEASQRYHLQLEISQDCHYCNKEDSFYQRLTLMIRTTKGSNKTIKDIQQAEEDGVELFELQDQNLWMKSEEELNEKWELDYRDIIPEELFEQAKINTVEICKKAGNVKLDRSIKLPQIPDADEVLKEELIKGFKRRGLNGKKAYMMRLWKEYDLIKRKGYSSYFLIVKKNIDRAIEVFPKIMGWGTGLEILSPGRGSCGGSLCAYCLGITQVDPIKYDLVFERFLNEARGEVRMKTRFASIPLPPDEDQ